jgi:hypothetical protein
MPDAPRRFPAPWRADKIAGGYVVRDANGQALASATTRPRRCRRRCAARIRARSVAGPAARNAQPQLPP